MSNDKIPDTTVINNLAKSLAKASPETQAVVREAIANLKGDAEVKNIAVVGHRPDKLGGYNADVSHIEDEVERVVDKIQAQFPDHKLVDLCGGAQGADWIGARVFFRTGREYGLYIPFEGQQNRWPQKAQQKYANLRATAAFEIITTTEIDLSSYSAVAQALQYRNTVMIDDADIVVAIWDGDQKGGTANAVKYAAEQNKPLIIISVDKHGQLTGTIVRNWDKA